MYESFLTHAFLKYFVAVPSSSMLADFQSCRISKMEITSWKIREGMFDEKIQNRTGSKMKDKNSIQILNKRDLITPVTSL